MKNHNAMRRRGNADHIAYSIRVESAGNAAIINRAGETVGILEDWVLFVSGERIDEINSYHEAIARTEKLVLTT